jgi:hypothetical protein
VIELALGSENRRIDLLGARAGAPFRGARLSPGAEAKDGEVTCELDLALESASPALIRAALSSLEQCLSIDIGAAEKVYVWARSLPGEALYRSPLLAGWLERLGGETARGALTCRLHLRRCNWWEGDLLPVELSNGNGSNVTGGLTLFNCCDGSGAPPALRQNYAQIAPGALAGDLPAPASFELALQPGSPALWDMLLAQNVFADPGGLVHWLEGESASSGLSGAETLTDSTCSGGQYKKLTWYGTGETQWLSWTLNPAMLAACGGNALRPVLRWQTALNLSEVWLQLRLTIGGGDAPVIASESTPVLARALDSRRLVELAPLRIPAERLPGSPCAAALELIARCGLSGSKSVGVDFLQLFPLDGYRRYLSLFPLNPGDTLVDDGIEGALYSQRAGGNLKTHSAQGDPLCLQPGRLQRLYFAELGLSSGGAVHSSVRLKAWYRPRRRMVD